MIKYPKTGIYKLTAPDGSVYIGKSKCLRKRISKYKVTNCKGQTGVYESYNKYGRENHVFEIISVLPDDITDFDLNNQENAFWYFYKEAGFNMLNINEPGNNKRPAQSAIDKTAAKHRGMKRSEESKRKMSEAAKGKYISPEHRAAISKAVTGNKYALGSKRTKEEIQKLVDIHSKPIIQMDMEFNFIKQWPSAAIAEKELNIDQSSIRKACRMEKYKSAGGFRWKFFI